MNADDNVLSAHIIRLKQLRRVTSLIIGHRKNRQRNAVEFARRFRTKRLDQSHPVIDFVLIGSRRRNGVGKKKSAAAKVIADPSLCADGAREDVASQIHPAIEAQVELLVTQPLHDCADCDAIITRWIVLLGHRGPWKIERHDLVD